MKVRLALALLLTCAACNQEDAPAEQMAEAAEQIVDPTPTPSPFAKGKWAPRDDCGEIEGATQFRQHLAEAINARDADAFAALAAEDVQLGFGGDDGREQLRTALKDHPAQWEDLEALLSLGCAANDQGGVTIPWLADQDFGDVDVFEGWIVTGEDVPVYRGPDRAADRIGQLSWDLVENTAYDPEKDFQQVKLSNGTQGYIATDKLRSIIDFRLIAQSRNGKWSILALVAGD